GTWRRHVRRSAPLPPRPPELTTPSRRTRLAARQRFFHEGQPVIAPEHFSADKKRRRTNHSPAHSLLGVQPQLLLDVRLFYAGENEVGVNARLAQNRPDHFRFTKIRAVHPKSRIDSPMVFGKALGVLGSHGPAHEPHG